MLTHVFQVNVILHMCLGIKSFSVILSYIFRQLSDVSLNRKVVAAVLEKVVTKQQVSSVGSQSRRGHCISSAHENILNSR